MHCMVGYYPVCTITFAHIILIRLGKILIKSSNSFNPTHHVSSYLLGHYYQPPQLHMVQNSLVKAQLSLREWINPTQTSDFIDPIAVLEHHLVINSKCPNSAPLFAYDTTSGWTPLIHSTFMDQCNHIWSLCELASIFRHGFCIRGTTHLICGIDPWIVMKQGHWSSMAFLLYWCKVESILSTFNSDSLDKLCPIKDAIHKIASM